MKDYEKKYKEALERAKKWYYAPNADKMPTYANRIIKEIFPELKESEDEKIRKTIIRFFKDNYPNETEMYDGSVTVGKAIAWLEKQGEQKTDKYEGYCEGCNNVKGCVTCVDGDQWAHYKEVEQKPVAWSDEDRDLMYDTLSNLTELKDLYGKDYGNVGKCIDRLKSLKARVQGKED